MTLTRIINVFLVSFKLCMIEITSNKTRSFISSLGIFLGTASLLVNMTFLRGMDADVKKSMAQIGGVTIISIKTVDAQNKEEQLSFGRSGGLNLAEVYELQRRIPAIEKVLPQVNLNWARVSGNGKHSGANMMAVCQDYMSIYNYEIEQGRSFIAEDSLTRAKVCVIGKGMATRLFSDPDSALGQKVNYNGVPFVVVGTIFTKDNFDSRARQMFIPFATYQAYFGGQFTKSSQISVKIDKTENIMPAARAMETQLRAAHRGVKDFEIEVNQDKIKEMETAALGIRVLLTSIAVISLSVGSISIMNIMFATIGDRIREIGLRKALGAQRMDVFMQFLIEAVLISFVGGVPGVLLGSLFTWLPDGTFPFTPQLSPMDYVVSAFFIAVTGVLSGLFPAVKAANMEPIEALRY